MPPKFLTALPVYNEQRHLDAVLDEVLRASPDVLVVDDGSRDGTSDLLVRRHDVRKITHERNQGYGAALRSAFEFTLANDYDVLVTIDCDGQHEPQRIGEFVAACAGADVVSGSRYLKAFADQSVPPEARRRINVEITAELNRRLGLQLTDGFCGFKAYSRQALRHFHITETGYAMPLELWVQAAAAKLKIIELAVPLIYLDEARSFGGSLDNAQTRLQYYYQVLDRLMGRGAVAPPHIRPTSSIRENAG
ncbi:MAG TPA: glycosyltransferase family 2 protein [Pirellulales bacterium]|nr:glycosyltransferase family 2 protein [Pirellulales bacterium]